MNIENGKPRVLNFSDIENILFSEKMKNYKIYLLWTFENRSYFSNRFRLLELSGMRKVFADYKNNKGGTGTFVLDENTLASNFCFIVTE